MKRDEVLKTAEQMVCGHREQDYGSPEDNFQVIASMWSVYLGYPIYQTDVAAMMALLKISRIAATQGVGSADSWVDLAGYAACGGEIATKDGE